MARNVDHIDIFNSDALSQIRIYLSPRVLFNFSLTCKTYNNALTYNMVLQSITMEGKSSSMASLATLIQLISKEAIWIPSPMRFLRCALGKRCESDRCTAQTKVLHLRPNYGTIRYSTVAKD